MAKKKKKNCKYMNSLTKFNNIKIKKFIILKGQIEAQRARNLINKLMLENPDLLGPYWLDGLLKNMAKIYFDYEMSYDDFCDSLKRGAKYYKYLWEKKE